MIVVVDNESDSLHLSEMLLTIEGFEVKAFTSGTAALEFINGCPPKLKAVLLDLSMPVLDGLTVVEQIRQNERAHGCQPVGLAFYTARNIDKAILRVAERENVERIFLKPQHTPELANEVRQWLLERSNTYSAVTQHNSEDKPNDTDAPGK